MKESTSQIINEFSKLILAIEGDSDDDPRWRRFYQIQMYLYLIEKTNSDYSLNEAEFVYNRILETWEDVKESLEKSFFHINNIDHLFRDVEIDFSIPNSFIVSK